MYLSKIIGNSYQIQGNPTYDCSAAAMVQGKSKLSSGVAGLRREKWQYDGEIEGRVETREGHKDTKWVKERKRESEMSI
jgi:hypothetical protein